MNWSWYTLWLPVDAGCDIFQTVLVQQTKCSWSDRARGASGETITPANTPQWSA
jgi:hypothetical protein